jgi:hypothetical protein
MTAVGRRAAIGGLAAAVVGALQQCAPTCAPAPPAPTLPPPGPPAGSTTTLPPPPPVTTTTLPPSAPTLPPPLPSAATTTTSSSAPTLPPSLPPVATTTTTLPPAPPRGLADTLGVYAGHGGVGCQRLLGSYEPFLGRRYRYAIENINFHHDQMTASAWGKVNETGAWQTVGLDDPRHIRLSITVPLRTGEGNFVDVTATTAAVIRRDLIDVANGSLDAKFLICANHLAGGGHGDAILRLGHEPDIRWYPWSIHGGNADVYIDAFRHAREVFRSVSPGFLVDYNVNGDALRPYPGFPNRLTAAYPGDAHVDIIGVNAYNRQPWPETQARLDTVAAFAAAHGKLLSVPEWGVWKNTTGDDVAYIERMHAWFLAHPVLYQGYFWRYLNSDFDPSVIDGVSYAAPNAKARYRALFG